MAAGKQDEMLQPVWDKMEQTLVDVYDIVTGLSSGEKLKDETKTKMEWFKLVFDVATKDPLVTGSLHAKLTNLVETQLQARVVTRVTALAKGDNVDALFRFVSTAYGDFKIWGKFARLVFSYLDQHNKGKLPLLKPMMDDAFHKAAYNSTKGQLMQVILKQVTARRDGNQIDLPALRNAVEIFTTVGTAAAASEVAKTKTYEDDFEIHYLSNLSNAYGQRAATELSREGGHYTYLSWVESRYDLERSLCSDLLSPTSMEKVLQCLDKQLLINQMKTVILHPDSGFGVLLEDWKETALASMFFLFRRVPENAAVKLMGEELKAHLTFEAAALVATFSSTEVPGGQTSFSNDKNLVESLLLLHDKYAALIKNRFENNSHMQTMKKEALESAVNVPLTRREVKPGAPAGTPSESKDASFQDVLASYCDAVLRRELKDITEYNAEVERRDKLINLFTYIKEKDIFQEYYSAKLAKRLLQTTPVEDLERYFLGGLQRVMGKTFTHKMEGMLHDRDSTKQMSDLFASDPSARNITTQFECQLLTAANWPAYKCEAMEPPLALRQCMTSFTLFYKKKHATRTLKWIHMLGSAGMNIAFPKGTKDVTATIYQATILMFVDDDGKGMTGKAIADAMKLDFNKIVKPNIASMYLSKQFPVLTVVDDKGQPATAAGKGISDSDIFVLNETFQHKQRKIKLSAPAQAASVGMPTEEDIDARRKAMMDACIVRVMKARRELQYNELTELAITQLSKYFTPQPKHVKKRIDDLITRGFMKRDEKDSARFEYIA